MKPTAFHLILISMLLLVFLSNCQDDPIEINSEADFEAYIQDEMDSQHIPNMSVLIFKEDEILYENYFNQPTISQLPLSIGSQHVFLIASISKVVTATALMQLYDNGAFELDDNINDYLPFSVNVPGYTRPMSFRMLLTHTAGIADNEAVLDQQYYYNQDSPISLAYFLENYLRPGGEFYDAAENFFDFEPGTRHEYSNTGSALIALLVENISGMEFNAYCKENIFLPLGMSHTFWRLEEVTSPMVMLYDRIGGENREIQPYTFTDYPNGGLRTNGQDMFQFLSAFTTGGRSGNFQLLQPTSIDDMLRPQIPSLDNEMGLHLFLMNREHNLWGHDGGEQGVATTMAFNPDTKVGVIIFANQGEADLDDLLKPTYEWGLQLQ